MHYQSHNIFFDWNGTLLDDTHTVFESTNAMLLSLEKPAISRQAFHANYSIPLEDFYSKIGLIKSETERDHANNVFHEFYESNAKRSQLRDGVPEILSEIFSYKIKSLILSNHIIGPIQEQLRRLNIEKYFTDILAYPNRENQFRYKNKKQHLVEYLASNNECAQQSLIIGDSLEEIQIAKELGLISVAITGGCYSEERLRSEGPNYLIHKMSDLKEILLVEGYLT